MGGYVDFDPGANGNANLNRCALEVQGGFVNFMSGNVNFRDAFLINRGNVALIDGRLSDAGGGASAKNYISNGGIITRDTYHGAGANTYHVDLNLSNSGRLEVLRATRDGTPDLTISRLFETRSGSIRIDPNALLSVVGTAPMENATIAGGGTLLVADGARLDCSRLLGLCTVASGTTLRSHSGFFSGQLLIDGTFDFEGGTLDGGSQGYTRFNVSPNGGAMNILQGGQFVGPGEVSLEVNGVLHWNTPATASTCFLRDHTQWLFGPNAQVFLESTGVLYGEANASVLNQGTITRRNPPNSGDLSTTDSFAFRAPFTNWGVINIAHLENLVAGHGEMSFAGPSITTYGKINIAQGATLDFSIPDLGVMTGSSFDGGGTLGLHGTKLESGGATEPVSCTGNVVADGGSSLFSALQIGGSLQVNGAGVFNTVDVAAGGYSRISGVYLESPDSKLVMHGDWSLAGGNTMGHGARILNEGAFTGIPDAPATIGYAGAPVGEFENAGVFVASPSLSSWNIHFRNMSDPTTAGQSGQVEVRSLFGVARYTQTAGSTVLEEGTLDGFEPVFSGGSVRGTGTIRAYTPGGYAVHVGEAGPCLVAPSPGAGSGPGAITVAADLIFGSLTTLEVEIGGVNPVTDHDQMVVQRVANFGGGTVSARLLNGFQPVAGQAFRVIAWNGHIKSPANYTGLALPNRLRFIPDVRADGLYLVAVPELRLSPEFLPGGQLRLSFPTRAGRTYEVYFKDDLGAPNWTFLQSISGDGTVKTVTPPVGPAKRFFLAIER